MQRKIVEILSAMAKRKTRKRQRLSDKAIRKIVSYVRKLRTQKLSPQMQKVVKRNASKLRIMSDPKVSLKRKRKLLVQKGGFIRSFVTGGPMTSFTQGLLKFGTSLMRKRQQR